MRRRNKTRNTEEMNSKVRTLRCYLCHQLTDANYGVWKSRVWICGDCCTLPERELKKRIQAKAFKENGKEEVLNPDALTLD